MRPKVESLTNRVKVLSKISKWHFQSAYANLGISL